MQSIQPSHGSDDCLGWLPFSGWPGAATLSFFSAATCLLGNAAHMKTVVGLAFDLLEYYITVRPPYPPY